MTPAEASSTGRGLWAFLGRNAAPAASVVGVGAAGLLIFSFSHPHPHALDIGLLSRQPVVVRLHLATALAALGLGAVMLLAPKGTLPHRTLGWIWVTLMLTVALSSIFIRTLNGGGFSPIHVLSAWVLFIVPVGVWAARTHRVTRHSRTMTWVYFMALLVAGAFTFFPGRLMWRLFLG